MTEWIAIALAALNLVLFTVSIVFLGRQIREQQTQLEQQQLQIQKADEQVKKEHDWNRRKAVVDLAMDYVSSERMGLRARLDAVADWYEPSQSFATLEPEKQEALGRELKLHLNYLEAIAVGVKHNIYDKEIAYEYFGALVPAAYRWARPCIEEARKDAGDPSFWEALERLAAQWAIENAEIARMLASEHWREGKPPT